MLLDWNRIETVIAESRMVLLYGPPGTGKTTAAVRAGSPASFFNVTLTDESPAAELRGHFVPRGGDFVWMDGPAMRAFRDGSRLVLNEVDKASDDALDFLHALLDDADMAAITLPTGETVNPGPAFQCIATMNGQPEDLPDAVLSRLATRLEILEPHPAAIAHFPVAVQDAIRGTIGVENDRRSELRAWNAYLKLAAKVGDETAALAVFQHRAQEVLNAVRLAGER